MTIQHFSRVVGKGIWRDLKTFGRYKARIIGSVLNLSILVFGFFIIGNAYNFSAATVDLTGINQDAVFAFLVTGISLQLFSNVATWAPVNRVERDIYYGTLESVFITPAPRIAYFLSTTASESIITSIFFVPTYILMMVLAGQLLSIVTIGYTLLIVLICVISLTAMGIFFAMLAILFRQTRAIISVLNQLLQFVTGAYIPVQAFLSIHPIGGAILKYFAMIFPYTYCYDLMRFYLIGGNYITLLPIWSEFLLIFGGTLFFMVLAGILLVAVEKKAKDSGLAML